MNHPSHFSEGSTSVWIRKKTHPKARDVKCCLLNSKLDSFHCLLGLGQPGAFSTAELKIKWKILSV